MASMFAVIMYFENYTHYLMYAYFLNAYWNDAQFNIDWNKSSLNNYTIYIHKHTFIQQWTRLW
jgi:hypothetical protein